MLTGNLPKCFFFRLRLCDAASTPVGSNPAETWEEDVELSGTRIARRAIRLRSESGSGHVAFLLFLSGNFVKQRTRHILFCSQANLSCQRQGPVSVQSIRTGSKVSVCQVDGIAPQGLDPIEAKGLSVRKGSIRHAQPLLI